MKCQKKTKEPGDRERGRLIENWTKKNQGRVRERPKNEELEEDQGTRKQRIMETEKKTGIKELVTQIPRNSQRKTKELRD